MTGNKVNYGSALVNRNALKRCFEGLFPAVILDRLLMFNVGFFTIYKRNQLLVKEKKLAIQKPI